MDTVEAVSSRTFGTLLLNCLAALSATTSEAVRVEINMVKEIKDDILT